MLGPAKLSIHFAYRPAQSRHPRQCTNALVHDHMSEFYLVTKLISDGSRLHPRHNALVDDHMPESLVTKLIADGSRLHWALLERDNVLEVWDTGHLGKADVGISPINGSSGGVDEGIPLSCISARAQDMLRRNGATIESPGIIIEV